MGAQTKRFHKSVEFRVCYIITLIVNSATLVATNNVVGDANAPIISSFESCNVTTCCFAIFLTRFPEVLFLNSHSSARSDGCL